MADTLNGIFISELLADNAGGQAIDTDGDGSTNKADEFIELQNNSATAMSLDGYEVWSETNGLLYSFGPGDTIAPGETATIVGNYTGTPPAGFYDGGVTESTNWIPDGEGPKFDTIYLVDTATGEFIALSYGNPPQTPNPPTDFPGTTQIGSGESIDSTAPNGTAFARDANGDLVETTPTPGTPNIPCFLKGTLIETPEGEVAVEHLEPGMLVVTKDRGPAVLRAIGCFAPSRAELIRRADLTPVTFPKGSIGNTRDLHLSAAHRILLKSTQAEFLFGEPEVLVSGRQCLGHRNICEAPLTIKPIYYHLLFDDHQIIRAQGCWVESLFLADLGLRSVDNLEQWRFAQDATLETIHHHKTARPTLKQGEAQVLLWEQRGQEGNFEMAQPDAIAPPIEPRLDGRLTKYRCQKMA